MDPPRAEAKQAIAECRQAGIAVKMITGDHQTTATAIASELGLQGRTVSGAELDRMDAEQLAAAIDEVAVFARVTASQQGDDRARAAGQGACRGDDRRRRQRCARIEAGGHRRGDGHCGTAVAKEAATMVLTDDNFATIVTAVRHGRTLYDNILKFVRFQLSTTIGAILTVFFAPLRACPSRSRRCRSCGSRSSWTGRPPSRWRSMPHARAS